MERGTDTGFSETNCLYDFGGYNYGYEEELDKNSKWYAPLRKMSNHTLAFILSRKIANNSITFILTKLEKLFIK